MLDHTVNFSELNIPPKYIKPTCRKDRVQALLNKAWLRQLVKSRRVPEFVHHDKLSDDEVNAFFKQTETFSSQWVYVVITEIKKDDKLVIPLPRARICAKPDAKLSLSQIFQYVAVTNHKNLWKEAYKKHNHGCYHHKDSKDDGSLLLMDQTSLVRDVLSRLFGVPVIKLGESSCPQDVPFNVHCNILPATALIESSTRFYIIQETKLAYTLQNCVMFSPSKLSSSYAQPLFIIFQLLRAMRHLHDMGLVLGDIALSDILVGEDLWIQILPRLVDNIYDLPKKATSVPDAVSSSSSSEQNELGSLVSAWALGALSNYDYLCHLNRLAGRRFGDPKCHYVLPWVSDFTSRSGPNWRDLTKSKFRLNKGDRQLDLTYQVSDCDNTPNNPQVAHHVPDVLSEITYFVYLARTTPKSLLCKYVRAAWVPAEYPASIQRLQEWTPDECIPEFFTDPTVFKSIHSDLGDLELPPWASSAQDFISHHRAALESQYVSERLHHWIDLTFGYKLSGLAAVKSKNVCLQLVDNHKNLCGSGVVQLFTAPHPHRLQVSPYWNKSPPRLYLDRRKPTDDEQGSSDDEEPHRSTISSLNKFMSRSRTSLFAPVGDNSQSQTLNIPREYNPTSALSVVESLHSFTRSALHYHVPKSPQPTDSYLFKQIVATRRAREMQMLGCLIVEILLSSEVRLFGNGVIPLEFSRRLFVCQSIVKQKINIIPKCVRNLVLLLLQVDSKGLIEENYPAVTTFGIPPPSAHQLLQPSLTSSLLPFPPHFAVLNDILLSLHRFSKSLALIQDDQVPSSDQLYYRISELKVKSIVNNVEKISEESPVCLELLLPYVRTLLSSPETDVIAAWYLFDHVARGLGPKATEAQLLETMVKLYDWDRPLTEPRLLQKRIKLYHRSFLLRLLVRFGLSTFLEAFVVPLVEAVGGYHDIESSFEKTSHLASNDIEEAVEADTVTTISPLDEDSSGTDTSKTPNYSREPEPEVFVLEDDTIEDESKGPRSASSLQNLLIDNVDSHSIEEKELPLHQGDEGSSKSGTESCDETRSKRSFSNSSRQFDPDHLDTEYSKVYVCEVSEVARESVVWLAHRLGPVLTARYLSRNLLRMLALCYTTHDNLRPLPQNRLVGDDIATSVLRTLISIAALYGEQFIIVQYFPHTAELVSQCKRKLTLNLEGGLIGCLTLFSHVLDSVSDSAFIDILQEGILKALIHPCLRLMASSSTSFPSGVAGRQAFASKLLNALTALVRRAPPPQRIVLLQTLQRFFLAFSKARGLCPDSRLSESSTESGISIKSKFKSDPNESPPFSLTPSDFDQNVERLKGQAAQELREVLNAEFAYSSYAPFSNFFGESMMEQSLKNYDVIRQLCDEYLLERQSSGKRIPGTFCIDPPENLEMSVDTTFRVGSFSNVILIGNRIDLQEPFSKSSSPGEGTKKTDNVGRHLKGNWVAYWEHEVGRSNKDTKINVKQIKLQTFSAHSNSVRHIVPLASENSFMSASRDKTVRLWSLRSQGDGNHVSQPQWTYNGHRKSVLSLGFLERCRLTVSCDSVVHLWDPFMGRVLALVGEPSKTPPVNTLITLPPPATSVLCATTDQTIRTLDSRTCSFVNELKVSSSPSGLIRCMVVSKDARWLAVGQASGIITVLDLKMGTVLSTWRGHESEILQLAAVDEYTLVSSSLDQAVCAWNVADGKIKTVFKGPSEPVHCLEVFNEEIIMGTTTNRLGVYSCSDSSGSYSSSRLRSDTFKGVLTSMALLPLNRLLLLGADSGNVTLIC